MSEEMVIEKESQWNNSLMTLDEISDRLGMPIDYGIREAVTGMNMLGFPTSGSCGGHLDEDRLAFPYLQGEETGEPTYRYAGEEDVLLDLAKKYGVSIEEIRTSDANEAYREYQMSISELPETEEYKEWYERNIALVARVETLLSQFNETHQTNKAVRLTLVPMYPCYRIEPRFDREIAVDPHNGLPIPGDPELGALVTSAQEEMRAFADYLKMRFLSEGK
jgi:hypothetical protein